MHSLFWILEFRPIEDLAGPKGMALQPQDVVIALHLALGGGGRPYAKLGGDLGLSPSQVHAAIRRAVESGLVRIRDKSANRSALLEFLIHGAKYAFPARRGPVVRGYPTAHSAPPLSDEIQSEGLPVVWPASEGPVRGESFEPLHRSAIMIARKDDELYRALALVDAIRGGRARERRMACEKLSMMLAA